MDAKEIKQTVSMPELLRSQGIEVNRHNQCCCFAHGEKHPSMKVYPHAVHCFACGYHADVLKVYMDLNRCDFKTAFESLGGVYEHGLSKSALEEIKRKEEDARRHREEIERQAKEEFKLVLFCLEICKQVAENFDVDNLPDSWENIIYSREFIENAYDEKYLKGNEVDDNELIAICKRVRHKFNS